MAPVWIVEGREDVTGKWRRVSEYANETRKMALAERKEYGDEWREFTKFRITKYIPEHSQK